LLNNNIKYCKYYGPLTQSDHIKHTILLKLNRLNTEITQEKALSNPISIALKSPYWHNTTNNALAEFKAIKRNHIRKNILLKLVNNPDKSHSSPITPKSNKKYNYKHHTQNNILYCIIKTFLLNIYDAMTGYVKKANQPTLPALKKDLINVANTIIDGQFSTLEKHPYFRKNHHILTLNYMSSNNNFSKKLFKIIVSAYIKRITIHPHDAQNTDALYDALSDYIGQLKQLPSLSVLPSRRTGYLKQYMHNLSDQT
jgi:hypothetical protein